MYAILPKNSRKWTFLYDFCEHFCEFRQNDEISHFAKWEKGNFVSTLDTMTHATAKCHEMLDAVK
jgi:hypothetical protein